MYGQPDAKSVYCLPRELLASRVRGDRRQDRSPDPPAGPDVGQNVGLARRVASAEGQPGMADLTPLRELFVDLAGEARKVSPRERIARTAAGSRHHRPAGPLRSHSPFPQASASESGPVDLRVAGPGRLVQRSGVLTFSWT
jgi:hypothetical protein